MFNYIFFNHIYLIFFFLKNFFFKTNNFGINSNSFFLLKKKKNFFYSNIFIISYKKLYNIKIFQNKINYLITKIITFYQKNTFYKKIIGELSYFPNVNFILKVSFLFLNLNKKKKIKKIKFNYFIFYKIKKNFISKFFFNIYKNKIKNTNLLIHNDLFKDNILFYGNFLISVIDLYNYNFNNKNNDIINLLYENCFNINLINLSIIENYFKLKKINLKKNNFFFIIKLFFYRLKKNLNNNISKNPYLYFKKKIYEIRILL
ncbi:putative homoserine kinase [Candidatus Carsonella ruddii CS isolate Thao2000]|uniref:Putative homoserine kinase n=1 Tax=Candidatus Carsonella ruddii CS isolate Thao2000 TaxID=1202537 RepID=J7GTH8_CARRU|nr:homoserine kinase [Candidatus Carsonella ruddii]AFP83844.1 putative homoserine kinase [Candidatus Carsonella ruddii CS isolate Thao2000]